MEGHVTFHTTRSRPFSQPAPGTAATPGPIKDLPAEKLLTMLGIVNVTLKQNEKRLATIDAQDLVMRLTIARRGALVAAATSIMLTAAVPPGSAQTATASSDLGARCPH